MRIFVYIYTYKCMCGYTHIYAYICSYKSIYSYRKRKDSMIYWNLEKQKLKMNISHLIKKTTFVYTHILINGK